MNITGTVKLTYFNMSVTNKGKNPEVHYDCFGNPVYVMPGETKEVRRVRREFATEDGATPEKKTEEPKVTKDAEHGEKQEQPKGKNTPGSGKSKN